VSPVVVHSIEVLGQEGEMAELEVRCSAGTYIRALARDMGDAVGTGAHLVALRRTASGTFTMADAVSWDEIGPAARVLPMDGLLVEIPAATVTAKGLDLLRHGRPLDRTAVATGFPAAPPPPRVRVLDEAGHLCALAVPRGFETPAPGLSMEPVLQPDIVLLE
jgi:tRNA pseudouridine55 synthase